MNKKRPRDQRQFECSLQSENFLLHFVANGLVFLLPLLAAAVATVRENEIFWRPSLLLPSFDLEFDPAQQSQN